MGEAMAETSGEATLERLPHDVSVAQIKVGVERSGAVIVEGFIPPGLLAGLQNELVPLVAARPSGTWSHPKDGPAGGSFAGAKTKRIGGIAAKSAAFHDMMTDTRMLALADHFLLPHCAAYRIHGTQLMAVGPGESDQLLHRDETDWPHFPPPKPHLTVGAMLALSDFTEANGATRVAPGSNHWPQDRQPEAHEIVQAAMPAGSALIYDGKVLHGAGANQSQTWRIGLWFAYALGWLRQYENQLLACPPDTARTMPVDVRRLLGYELHDSRPGQGGVDAGDPARRDPEQLFDGGQAGESSCV